MRRGRRPPKRWFMLSRGANLRNDPSPFLFPARHTTACSRCLHVTSRRPPPDAPQADPLPSTSSLA